MYDPCIGSFDAQNDIYTVPFIEQNNNVFAYTQSYLDEMTKLDDECGWNKCKHFIGYNMI